MDSKDSILSLPVLQHILLPNANDVAARAYLRAHTPWQASPLLSWDNSGQITARSSAEQ